MTVVLLFVYIKHTSNCHLSKNRKKQKQKVLRDGMRGSDRQAAQWRHPRRRAFFCTFRSCFVFGACACRAAARSAAALVSRQARVPSSHTYLNSDFTRDLVCSGT